MRNVTFKGNAVTLAGRALTAERPAPDFKVVSQDLKDVELADFKGKIIVINSFPSLDTPVCDMQVKEFNKRAAGLSQDVVILGISKDLPFAQRRFCETFEIKNVKVFSDYKTSSFGINYGLLIKELNLLARGALIIDKTGVLRYVQIAKELTASLNYDDVLKNLEEVVKNPSRSVKEGLGPKCKPCEAGSPPLAGEALRKMSVKYPDWQLADDKKIVKEFKFKDFAESRYFLDLVSVIAEEQGHHPAMTIAYNRLKVVLTTHASGGLTENDFIMAGIIDELQGL